MSFLMINFQTILRIKYHIVLHLLNNNSNAKVMKPRDKLQLEKQKTLFSINFNPYKLIRIKIGRLNRVILKT